MCFAGLISYFITGDQRMLPVAVFGFAMMLPYGSIFSDVPQKSKIMLYTLGMTAVGIAAIVSSFMTGDVFNGFSVLFVFSFVAYQFMANYFRIKASNR